MEQGSLTCLELDSENVFAGDLNGNLLIWYLAPLINLSDQKIYHYENKISVSSDPILKILKIPTKFYILTQNHLFCYGSDLKQITAYKYENLTDFTIHQNNLYLTSEKGDIIIKSDSQDKKLSIQSAISSIVFYEDLLIVGLKKGQIPVYKDLKMDHFMEEKNNNQFSKINAMAIKESILCVGHDDYISFWHLKSETLLSLILIDRPCVSIYQEKSYFQVRNNEQAFEDCWVAGIDGIGVRGYQLDGKVVLDRREGQIVGKQDQLLLIGNLYGVIQIFYKGENIISLSTFQPIPQ